MSNTREQLLKYAFDLVQERGINAMSYSDLSDAIGIKKASIHYHFPRKEDLINELLSYCEEDYGKRYEAVVSSELSPEEKLMAIGDIYSQGVRDNKICLINILSAEKDSLENKSVKHLENAIDRTVRIFEKIFTEATAKGDIPENFNTLHGAQSFFSLLNGAQNISRSAGDRDFFKNSVSLFVKSLFS